MTHLPPPPAYAVLNPPPRSPARRGWLWPLRLTTLPFAVALAAQPLLAGRFLQGDYPSLGTHGVVGLSLMAWAWLVAGAAVLAWRPGRLPAWPAVTALALALLLPVQLGMGHARLLAVHLTLGVALVGAGIWLAAWAWRPARGRR